MSETKDLAYYAANPDAIANLSDAELDALAGTEGDTGEPDNGEAPAAVTDDAAAGQADAAKADTKPAGIATKDGKHVIPFDVLERERLRSAELEQLAREQAAKIEALTRQTETGEPAGESSGEQIETLTDEQIAELEQEVPSLARLLKAQQAQMQALAATVQALNAEKSEREHRSATTVQQTVQDAIDSNPKLAYLQAQDDATWQRAVRLDGVLKADPEWASKSFADRFEKVVELYEATYGQLAVQGNVQPSQSDIEKRAAARLNSRPSVPASMSAIPGGSTPPADDVLGALTSKSGAELTADFMKMTPDQIEAMLARL